MGDVTTNFSYSEFRCLCGECELNGRHMDLDFLHKLQTVRAWYDHPMYPSSGCRCPKYNTSVGGVAGSFHLLANGCMAADFPVKTSQQRAVFVKLALREGLTVGLSENFIHFDNRDRQIIFLY